MRVMLHACCGPCSLEPVRVYREEKAHIAVYYDNPNIHPDDEYARRLEAIENYVIEPNSLPFYEGPYDPDEWEQRAGRYGTDREKRCRACYRLRFERLAAKAAEEGYDAIGSTLTISPYQYTNIIIEELERAAALLGLKADARNWSSHYQEATRRSRELGMYRQNYCGCRFSIAEAVKERRDHALKRAEEKRIKQLALLEAAAEGVVNQLSQL